MPKAQAATVHGQPICCPICSHDAFRAKRFYASGSWAQAFDVEAIFGREGLMLICENCSHIQHFADHRLVELRDHVGD